MSPAHKTLWTEFHAAAGNAGHTTDYYNGDNEVRCSLCDRIVRVLFGTLEATTDQYNYQTKSWWSDDESEILDSYRMGDSKNWSEEQWLEHVLTSSKRRFEDQKGTTDDPFVRCEVRRWKTVTYKRDTEVLWKSDGHAV